ncbi:MAG: DegV family protein [Chloroflexota bacterium]
MAIRIVTDSSADLPAELVRELGITVVPLYVRFGEEVYRDRVDISEDEFYQRLQYDAVHPSTVQPSPQDFADVYQPLSGEADGIVSVHISSKLSGTYNSAMRGKEIVRAKCPIEVIDSQTLTMALGMLAVMAARLARQGKGLAEVVAAVKQAVPVTHLLGLLDTLKYVMLGGRIGKAKALLGSILNVKPLLSLQEGEVIPAGQARTRSKGIDRLFDFVQGYGRVQDLAVVYNTTPEEAETLAGRLGTVFDRKQITLSRVGPVLGTHMGPAALIVTFRT